MITRYIFTVIAIHYLVNANDISGVVARDLSETLL